MNEMTELLKHKKYLLAQLVIIENEIMEVQEKAYNEVQLKFIFDSKSTTYPCGIKKENS
ncbi:MAG: hypothetical protein V3U02_12645 [Calditrichia bacterium]